MIQHALFLGFLSCSVAIAHEGHEGALVPPKIPVGSAAKQSSSSPVPQVEITEVDGYRVIKSNSVPAHAIGQFPNRGNPHTMSPQSILLKVPITPTPATSPVANGRGFFGVALNGVPFEPHTAEYWKNDRSSGWRMEVKSPRHSLGLDQNNAHVQGSGLYHYHGPPVGLIAGQVKSDGEKEGMIQLGWAADGFPIYASRGHADPGDAASPIKKLRSSWQLKKGDRPSPPAGPGGTHDGRYEQDFEFVAGSGDLDELNGRLGVTPEFPDGTYYYVVTAEFPFLSRSFKGVPDQTFLQKGGLGGHGAGRGPRGPQGERGERGGRGGRGGRGDRGRRPGGPRGPDRDRNAPPQ